MTTSGLIAEPRQGPVADGAAGDAPVLELLLARQAEVVGPGAGGHDHRLSLVTLAVGSRQAEGARLDIDVDDIVGYHPGAEVPRLPAHHFHQRGAGNPVPCAFGQVAPGAFVEGIPHRAGEIGTEIAGGEAGIVFNLGREGQLTQGKGWRTRLASVTAPSKTKGLRLALAA